MGNLASKTGEIKQLAKLLLADFPVNSDKKTRFDHGQQNRGQQNQKRR
jgi:hypothetical protein